MTASPTESAGDRDSVSQAIENVVGLKSVPHFSLFAYAADAAISALRARGVSREEIDAIRHSLKCVESERDLARERLSKAYADCSLHQDCAVANAEAHDRAQKEIARLRAALELISGDSTWRAYAQAALNAGAKP